MTPKDARPPEPALKAKWSGETLVVAIPALAALVLGSMFVMPTVFASATTSQAVSVWGGPVIARPAASGTPLVPTSLPIPSIAPSVSTTPTVEATAAATTVARKAATTAPAKKATTRSSKTTTATASSPASPTGPMLVTVNVAGGQPEIDACKGPVLVFDQLIAEHNVCGGSSFYVLKVGSLVTLAGRAVTDGAYRVSFVVDIPAHTELFAIPVPYALQTCMSSTVTRLWYLVPV